MNENHLISKDNEECCGHHHHYHDASKTPSVSAYSHETASVGTVKCRIDGDYEQALNALKHCMKETAEAVEQAGGLIGHLKAIAREKGRSCALSITDGEDLQCKPYQGTGISVESANIVFGITPEKLEAILKEAFKNYLS